VKLFGSTTADDGRADIQRQYRDALAASTASVDEFARMCGLSLTERAECLKLVTGKLNAWRDYQIAEVDRRKRSG